MVAHHFHVSLLPLATLAGINVRLARGRTGQICKRTQPVQQDTESGAIPVLDELAEIGLTLDDRRGQESRVAREKLATSGNNLRSKRTEFRRLSLHGLFCSPLSIPARAHQQRYKRRAHSSTQRASALLQSPQKTRHHTIMRPVGRPMAPSASFCRPRLPPAMTP